MVIGAVAIGGGLAVVVGGLAVLGGGSLAVVVVSPLCCDVGGVVVVVVMERGFPGSVGVSAGRAESVLLVSLWVTVVTVGRREGGEGFGIGGSWGGRVAASSGEKGGGRGGGGSVRPDV